MTTEAQRIAITEACGWTETEAWLNGRRCFEHADSNAGWDFDSLPDYLNDLNAMHEAEKMIGPKWPTYCEILLRIVEPDPRTLEVCHYWNLLHATAAQRAEAFLKTINKWKNDN